MALLDTLRDRTAGKGRTAQVNCGELGLLTVEALTPAECSRLAHDSRALLYAACRELQSCGEALRREKKLFRPDEIMEYVSGEEAALAAKLILRLSGVSEVQSSAASAQAAQMVESNESLSSIVDTGGVSSIVDTELSKVRLLPVQTAEENSEAEFLKIRHQSVQTQDDRPVQPEQNRLESVQASTAGLSNFGQVSRETAPTEAMQKIKTQSGQKTQILEEMSGELPQIVEVIEKPTDAKSGQVAEQKSTLHEIKSERRNRLHETESEFAEERFPILHESESEFAEKMHEIKSESRHDTRVVLHETESDSGEKVHETKSESRVTLHEIKSELKEMLHEIKSDLVEEAAERLAEELRRAARVR